MWPDTFGLACCAIEMMSIVSSSLRHRALRDGGRSAGSPRQADLLIVSGRVSHKMAAPLRQIYDQMLEPKWVIAWAPARPPAACSTTTWSLQSVDKIVPGRHRRAGFLPRPERVEGIVRLHEAVHAGCRRRTRSGASRP